MRAVFDPNVLISALLSGSNAPGRALKAWLAGAFELVVSDRLLDELENALAYPKLAKRVAPEDIATLVKELRRSASVAADPEHGTHHSRDPNDDYLLALAEAERALLVSGDSDLLALAQDFPVMTHSDFLDSL